MTGFDITAIILIAIIAITSVAIIVILTKHKEAEDKRTAALRSREIDLEYDKFALDKYKIEQTVLLNMRNQNSNHSSLPDEDISGNPHTPDPSEIFNLADTILEEASK